VTWQLLLRLIPVSHIGRRILPSVGMFISMFPVYAYPENARKSLTPFDALYDLLEQADEAANPGLKYFNHQYKGFFAVRATKERHAAEFFVVTPETIKSDYAKARKASGNIVADFMCDAQLTTTAGMPGSLRRLLSD
jgi:hypothetical protein